MTDINDYNLSEIRTIADDELALAETREVFEEAMIGAALGLFGGVSLGLSASVTGSAGLVAAEELVYTTRDVKAAQHAIDVVVEGLLH